MEKKLSALSFHRFMLEVLNETRQAAQKIPTFRDSHNGCIRITVVPLSRKANIWSGKHNIYHYTSSEFKRMESCTIDFVYKIDDTPNASYTILWTDPKDGHIEPVNCYGYSALKTAWALEKHRQARAGSSAEPYMGYYIEENGWSTHEGAVCATIILDGEDFADFCVCASGAESKEDEQCSLAGVLAAQRFFKNYAGEAKFDPCINGKTLERTWCSKS